MESGLYVVGTPIGNLSDLSGRAAETLAGVDVVYAEDTRRTGVLLRQAGIDVRLRSLHEHNEAARSEEVVELVSGGGSAALVSDAGTPAISDPGRRVVGLVLEAGLPVRSVPGPSAPAAALSVAGLPADRYTFLGFAPRSGAEREAWLARAAASTETVVAFESPRRTAALLGDLEAEGLGERTCVLCRELTKLHEEVLRSTVARLARRLAADEPRGEVTLVLEGGTPPDWQDSEDEMRREARRRAAAGETTRDIADRLQRTFGAPRNRAYEIALDAATGAG